MGMYGERSSIQDYRGIKMKQSIKYHFILLFIVQMINLFNIFGLCYICHTDGETIAYIFFFIFISVFLVNLYRMIKIYEESKK